MSQIDQSQAVRSYLRELSRALSDVPREVAEEIANGVAEELAGLSTTDAVARIEELGDPKFIAAEALANSEPERESLASSGWQETPATRGDHGPQVVAPNNARVTAANGDPRWYIVVASLLVALGGIVIPVLGWIAGIVMVWMSKTWRTWEKWVGTLGPLAIAGFLILGSFLARELAPNSLAGWHLAILSIFFSPFLAGMWLLWRGLRR